MVLPIVQGRLRGAKWIVGAGEHGYWLGSYELNKRQAFEREIGPDQVVYDIGANVGYFSLLAAELVGSHGQVYAFEPLPRNIAFLRQHIALNQLTNVAVVEAAVSDQNGSAAFDLGASSAMGHIADQGAMQVDLVRLDDLLADHQILPPDFIKIDVEGTEDAVLRGAQSLITTCQPTLFLDTHQREAHASVIATLQAWGYTFEILDGKPLPETKELIARPG